MKNIIVIALGAIFAFYGWAATETIDGVTWSYTVSKGKAEVTGASAETIIIPSTLGGYPVTSIKGRAFYGCSSITSVKIPDSITSIGESVFWECSSLGDVKIGNGVTSINQSSFCGCTSLSNVIIGSSVSVIGQGAFSSCKSLSNITIPDSVTHIANYAFNWCSSLTNVTIGKCVSNIGSYVFSGCSSLISIKVSENNDKYLSLNGLLLSKDGKNVFQGVNGIVVVPEGVTNICSNAFYNLFSLKSDNTK